MTMILLSALLIGNVLLLIIVTYQIILTKRALRFSHSNVHTLHKDIHVFTASLAGLGKRLVNVEKHFSDVVTTQNEITQMAQADNKKSYYEQAVEMIKLGASVTDIMKTCGLTQAEVDLLKNLHAST